MMAPRVLLFVAASVVALGLGASARAEEPSNDPSVGRVEIWAALPKEPPFVGEPIMLHMRSSLRAKTTRDKILQPALIDFDWQQFGIDKSSEEMLDGYWTPVLERVLVITPLKAGALTIPPFIRRAEFLAANGEREETEFSSRPLAIDVRSHEGVGPSGAWWLPAKSMTISDRWEPAPRQDSIWRNGSSRPDDRSQGRDRRPAAAAAYPASAGAHFFRWSSRSPDDRYRRRPGRARFI